MPRGRCSSMNSLARHTVRQGEDLLMLAEIYYADWTLWPIIADANSDLALDPDAPQPGIVIEIPALPISESQITIAADPMRDLLLDAVVTAYGGTAYYASVLDAAGLSADEIASGEITLPALGDRVKMRIGEAIKWQYLRRR